MVSVNDYCMARSLGEPVDLTKIRWPGVPEYRMTDMKLSYRNGHVRSCLVPGIKELVLLGSLPQDPCTFLVLRSASRIHSLEGHIDEAIMMVPSLSIWRFHPVTQTLHLIDQTMAVHNYLWQSLVRATTAFIDGSQNNCIQVLAYSDDPSSEDGYIEIRYVSGLRNTVFPACSRVKCATAEAVHAKTCFSKSQFYTATLLTTRCIFFVTLDKLRGIPETKACR